MSLIQDGDYDDVLGINKNKHSPDNKPYNSGKILIGALINDYCPFKTEVKVNNLMPFDSETIKIFPKNIYDSLGFVKGLPGVYLREKYNWKSTFLSKQDGSLFRIGFKMQGNDPVYLDYVRPQLFYYAESFFDNPQDGTGPVYESEYEKSSLTKKTAVWRYYRDYEAVMSDKEEESSNPHEYGDGAVYYIGQSANYIGCSEAGGQAQGIHWRAVKKDDLFTGEDFVICFKRLSNAINTNNNIELTPFTNPDIGDWTYGIDVGLANGVAPSPENPPPAAALVSYETVYKDGKVEASDTKQKQEVVGYIPDIASVKKYAFNNQSYYIVKFSSDSGFILLIFAQRSSPIAIEIKQKVENMFLNISNNHLYNL
jgi:hypothetical protein